MVVIVAVRVRVCVCVRRARARVGVSFSRCSNIRANVQHHIPGSSDWCLDSHAGTCRPTGTHAGMIRVFGWHPYRHCHDHGVLIHGSVVVVREVAKRNQACLDGARVVELRLDHRVALGGG